MDNPGFSNEDNQWVDNRIASLSPPPGWRPNADRAFEQIQQQSSAESRTRGLRILMAAATLGVIAVTLTLLPWNLLWSSQKAESSASTQQTPEPAKVEPLPEPAPTPAPAATAAAAAATKVQEPSQPTTRKAENPDIVKEVEQILTGGVSSEPATAKQQPQPAPPPGVTAPILISQVQPTYTPEAKEARIQGTIEIVATVNEDGSVKVESVKKGLGYGLDEAATAAVEQWRFRPGTKDGKPVATMMSLLVNFSLR